MSGFCLFYIIQHTSIVDSLIWVSLHQYQRGHYMYFIIHSFNMTGFFGIYIGVRKSINRSRFIP